MIKEVQTTTCSSVIKRGLLLLGSVAIAYNLSMLLHEFCHSMAAYLTGGNFGSILINPFSWSYSFSYSPSPLMHRMAGPYGSSIVGLILFLPFYRWFRSFLLPFILIAPISLISDGSYLLIDTIMKSGGDACAMIKLGVPKAVVILSAIVLLLAGAGVALLAIRKTGMLSTNFKNRLAIMSLGVLPYSAITLIWNHFNNSSEIILWSAYAAFETVAVFVLAAIPFILRKMLPNKRSAIRWREVVMVNVFAVGFVLFLMYGPISGKPFGKKTYSKRPDFFPPVLTLPSFAVDPSYGSTDLVKARMSYNVGDNTAIELVRDHITKLHEKNGYTLFLHDMVDPNKIVNNDWKHKEVTEDGIRRISKSYSQDWIKIDKKILLSHVRVASISENGQNKPVFVINMIFEALADKIYAYMSKYPDEFTDKQFEQIKLLLQD